MSLDAVDISQLHFGAAVTKSLHAVKILIRQSSLCFIYIRHTLLSPSGFKKHLSANISDTEKFAYTKVRISILESQVILISMKFDLLGPLHY